MKFGFVLAESSELPAATVTSASRTFLSVQDAWRISPRLTLTYGLCWEVNPAPGEANGNQPLTLTGIDNPSTAKLAAPGTKLYPTTYGNFAPRVGVAYQPFRTRGTVLRAGFGMFYDLGYAFTGTALTPNNFPYSRIRTLSNAPLNDRAYFSNVGPQTSNPPYLRLFDYDDRYKLPYTMQFSLALEQPIGIANSISASYVGAAGRHLARIESLRTQVLQNPLFTRVDSVNNGGYSDYHSLQLQFKRRVTRGLQALTSYTWSKSLDTASDESITNLAAPLARMNPDNDRGPSSFDIRHALTGSTSYQMPKKLGGFALDSIVRLRTAAPVTVVTGRDPLGLGLTNVARPDLVPGQPLYLYSDALPGGKRFNPAAFDGATPLAQARQGTLGRGTLRGFGLQQVDLALRRRFTLHERLGLELRADAFNIFNTANFSNPIGVLTNTNFGRSTQILSTGLGGLNPLFQIGGPRSMQLSLRLQF